MFREDLSIEELLSKDWAHDGALVESLWWDWACPGRQLSARGKRMLRLLRDIADSPRFDKHRYRTFFKNICMGTEKTIDLFYVVPMSDDPRLMWYTVCLPRRRGNLAELHAGPQGTGFRAETENMGFGTWDGIRGYFLDAKGDAK